MFGKGGGALGAWLKEFCQLVFIQTIQAFIYAIIIVTIMELYTAAESAVGLKSSDGYATGLGLFAVVALLSVFKIEDVARRIFGFGATKADHGNAIKSIAKTAFAVQLGKRVLNNGKQVVGGAKNMLGANKDAKKAASRLERRKQALINDNPGQGEQALGAQPNSSSGTPSGLNVSNSSNDNRQSLDEKRKKMLSMAEKMRARANSVNMSKDAKAELLAKADRLQERADRIQETMDIMPSSGLNSALQSEAVSSEFTNGTRNVSGNASVKSGSYHQKMLALQEEYEKEISDAKKKRKEGFRTMTRGVVESAGSVVGGTAGAILGVADGDLDGGINGMMSGAGLGDAAGAFATNTVFGATDLVEGAAKATSGAIKDYSSSIKQQYETERRNASSQLKDLNDGARSEINRINKSAERARADLEKEVELSAGQTAKAIAKAAVKGSAKAYKSRHGGIKQLETGLSDLKTHIETSTKQIKLDNNVESID